jgi:hypothetical protein
MICLYYEVPLTSGKDHHQEEKGSGGSHGVGSTTHAHP